MNDNTTKTDWQKYLKTLAICFIVIDLIFIVLGGIIASGTIDPEFAYGLFDVTPDMFAGIDATAAISALGIALIIVYAANLVVSLFVYRGAKNPSKIKVALVLTGIVAVISVVDVVKAIAVGEPFATALGQTVLVCTEFYGCYLVSKQNQ